MREESRKWIADFAEQLAPSGSVEEGHTYDDHVPMTYARLLAAADRWVMHNEYFTENGHDNWRDLNWNDELIEEFWTHYEIVTGRKPTDRSAFFSCTC